MSIIVQNTILSDAHDLQNCVDGEVKLTGGNGEEGLLKICNQNTWGTVCNLNWDNDIDATVACHQLGFKRAGKCS